MKLSEEIKNQIIEALKPLDPEKVILFGSYAYGEPTPDSDIDLYIVTKDDFMPQSFKEKNILYLRVSKCLRNLRKVIPIDLIVHSKKVYELFSNSESSFYRNDINNGVVLI
jgi:predicted nucleotidyltransferase